MSDPRLNSVHLDAPRRLLFRQARDGLLNARGYQTVAAEEAPDESSSVNGPHTMVLQPDSTPPPGVRFWLVDKEFLYPLKVGLNTIGRAPENDVVVPDAYVSRRHCAILVHAGDGCELHDIASKNGTFLNGNKLGGPTPLAGGDEIRMCDRQMVFMARSDEAAAGPAQTQTA
ncbi:MAG TPA: FHA domain-containing protein [Gemmataceae bacterium]|nr:FHA domain-containing protein [Gemmataceae bacterium]